MLISIVTPTYQRHRFFQQMVRNLAKQTYPLSNIEWIVIDDGPCSIQPLIERCFLKHMLRDLVYVYFKPNPKLTIGQKRNIGKSMARGEYILHMDDDDWYSSTYIYTLCHYLSSTRKYQIVGATTMYFIFKDTAIVQKSGPFSDNHCCAGLMGYTRKYAELTSYDNSATHGEEKSFLRSFHQPVLQIPDSYTIFLGINHLSNTCDKTAMKRESTMFEWWKIITSLEEQMFYFNLYKQHYKIGDKHLYNLHVGCLRFRFLMTYFFPFLQQVISLFYFMDTFQRKKLKKLKN